MKRSQPAGDKFSVGGANRRDLILGLAASGSVLTSRHASAQPELSAQPSDSGADPAARSAPAILRGSIYAHRSPGVTLGPGQTQVQQVATLPGLQAALDEAAAKDKYFEIEPGVYEVYGPDGLTVPPSANGFKWAGSVNARLIQFCRNAPILTIGDTAGNGYAAHQTITGFCLNYGVDQSGQSDAVALRLGAAAWVIIEQFSCAGDAVNPPNIGLAVTSANTANRFFFQNTIRNGEIGGGQTSLLAVKIDGTGNLWEDIYTHFGADAASRRTCAGPAWDLHPPGQMDDNVFLRCNIEHVSSNVILAAHGTLNCVFVGLHLEDVGLTGQNPAVVTQDGGQIRFIQSLIMDLELSPASGQGAVHRAAGYGEHASFDGLHFKWSDYASRALGADLRIVGLPSNNGNDTNPAVVIAGLTVQDDPRTNGVRMSLNAHFDQPLIDGTFVAEVQDDNLLPSTRHLQLIISAAYVHYGMHEDAVLFVPAGIASFAITLSDRFKAEGQGSKITPRPGARVRVRRQSGEARGTLTMIDAATSEILATNTNSGADFVYVFDVKRWALVD